MTATLDFKPMACNTCFCLVHPDDLTNHVAAVHQGVDSPGDLIAEWLEGVDAEELERVTLEMIGYSDSATKTMLGVLASWARGRSTREQEGDLSGEHDDRPKRRAQAWLSRPM